MSKSLSRLSDEFVLQFSRDLYHCSSCNYCVDAVWPERGMNKVCVTMEHHTRAPGYSGRGFIEAARAVLEGTPLDAGDLAERVFTCTSCGNCESACPIGLRPASIGQALREELVDADCVPEPVAAARSRQLSDGNPYGAAKSSRADWAADIARSPDTAGPVYFVGCAAALALPEEARAGYELLQRAGLAPQIATTECCGAPLAAYGDEQGAQSNAAACAEQLDLHDRLLIVAGYECRRQLEPAFTTTPLSLPAWLLGALDAGEVTLERNPNEPPPATVYLLESCELKPRIADAPAPDETNVRDLLAKLGVQCANSRYPSAYAPCCGAGGSMPVMQPEASRRMASARLPGAGTVMSLDPRCAAHLRQACNDSAIAVDGFAQFIVRHFVVTPTTTGD